MCIRHLEIFSTDKALSTTILNDSVFGVVCGLLALSQIWIATLF